MFALCVRVCVLHQQVTMIALMAQMRMLVINVIAVSVIQIVSSPVLQTSNGAGHNAFLVDGFVMVNNWFLQFE